MLGVELGDFIKAVQEITLDEQNRPDSSFCPYNMQREELREYAIYEKALDLLTQGRWREVFTNPQDAEFDKLLAVAYATALNRDFEPKTDSAQISAKGLLKIPSVYLVHQDKTTEYDLQIGEQESQGVTLERGFFLNLKVTNASGRKMRLSIKDDKGESKEGFFIIKDQTGNYHTLQGDYAIFEGTATSIVWMSTRKIPNTTQISIQIEDFQNTPQGSGRQKHIFIQ